MRNLEEDLKTFEEVSEKDEAFDFIDFAIDALPDYMYETKRLRQEARDIALTANRLYEKTDKLEEALQHVICEYGNKLTAYTKDKIDKALHSQEEQE